MDKFREISFSDNPRIKIKYFIMPGFNLILSRKCIKASLSFPKMLKLNLPVKILQFLTLSLLFSLAVFSQSVTVIARNPSRQTLSITTASSLPPTNIEMVYSQNLNSAGGSGTKTWRISSGSLPVGLAFDTTAGVISGIARSVGTSVFTARVTDGSGAKADKVFTLQVVAVTNSVTVEGDSRTVGYPVAINLTYPVKLQALLGPTWRVRNVAANGQTTDNMLADAPTQVDAFRDASLKRDVVILWTGINDINDSNRTGQYIYNNILDYARGKKAISFEMWVCTEIPGVVAAEREIARLNFNQLIKANYSPADKLIDLNALAAFASKDNTTYYQPDRLHLTEAANEVLANTFFKLLKQPRRH